MDINFKLIGIAALVLIVVVFVALLWPQPKTVETSFSPTNIMKPGQNITLNIKVMNTAGKTISGISLSVEAVDPESINVDGIRSYNRSVAPGEYVPFDVSISASADAVEKPYTLTITAELDGKTEKTTAVVYVKK